jgi:hypothetical protein
MYSIITKRIIKVSFFSSASCAPGQFVKRTTPVTITVRTPNRAHAVAKLQSLAEKYGNAWLFKGTKDIASIQTYNQTCNTANY